jgi:hypothetical protein
MPAKAIVPIEAFPCINRFRGHGPLLQDSSLRQRTVDAAELQERVMPANAPTATRSAQAMQRLLTHFLARPPDARTRLWPEATNRNCVVSGWWMG